MVERFGVFVGAFLLGLSFSATGATEEPRLYYRDRGPQRAATLTVPLVAKALEGTPAFTSVETFLGWLETNHPDHLEGLTFVRKSESSQGASNQHPRAIVYGPDAKFIYTFNGAPQQKGFLSVEIIAFVDKTWEFRELTFHADGKSKPSLSDANPSRCTKCHYSPMRPIWEQYDIWPGVYGRDDDGIIDFHDAFHTKYPSPPEVAAPHEEELAAFRTFQAIQPTHDRYKKLKLPEGSVVSPYNNSRRGDYKFRTNLRLTELLSGLHAQHLVAQMRKDEAFFKAMGPALARKLILACDNDAETSARVDALLAEKFPGRTLAGYNFNGAVGDGSKLQKMYAVFGLEHFDYNLSREPQRWQYFTGGDYLDEFVGPVLYRELSELMELPPTEKTTAYSHKIQWPVGEFSKNVASKTEHELCDILLKKHDLTVAPSATVVSVPPVARCNECHTAGPASAAPQFDLVNGVSRETFDKVMSRVASQDPAVRMPPNRNLSQKEIEALKAHLLKHLQE